MADETTRDAEAKAAAKTWPFICPHCREPSNAIVCGKAVWRGWKGDPRADGPPAEWTMVQCHRCHRPTVQLREDHGGGFNRDLRPVSLYPAQRQLSESVPEGLRREFHEAGTCLDAGAFAACAVMVRRTLEGTCEEQGVSRGPLRKRLQKMADDGLIDATLAEWADALRVVGNKGAHYTGKPLPREDAEDALAFAEALLDHIYVLRKRFEAFRMRLQSSQ